MTSSHSPAKPFVKWAGGKAQILHEIRAKYPADLGNTVTKYAEPLVGGGAVLFDVLSRYSLKAVYINDSNRELMATYMIVRDQIDNLITVLKIFEAQYRAAKEAARKDLYYANRDCFNTLKQTGSSTAELAALFIFLNRTCFNGLYRVNAKGDFNVPQGRYKNPTICDESNLRAASRALQGVTIACEDYKESARFIDGHTFVYFDPPYRPLTATARFTAYTGSGFGDEQQKELAHFIDEMSARGATILASNSDPKNADEHDDFFDELYKNHTVTRISGMRAINAAGTGRGRISELLISNT